MTQNEMNEWLRDRGVKASKQLGYELVQLIKQEVAKAMTEGERRG